MISDHFPDDDPMLPVTPGGQGGPWLEVAVILAAAALLGLAAWQGAR